MGGTIFTYTLPTHLNIQPTTINKPPQTFHSSSPNSSIHFYPLVTLVHNKQPTNREHNNKLYLSVNSTLKSNWVDWK